MTTKNYKRLMLSATIGAYVLAGAANAQAQPFDIEAQPLSTALLEFGEQSGVNVAVSPELIANKQAPSVRGEMEPEVALEKILTGSGLRSNELSTGAYTITLASADADEARSFRVAQLDKEDDVRRVETEENEDENERDTIVVTGTNIRGVEATGASALVFDRAALDNSGFSSTEDFFESLPQNLDEISSDATFGDGGSRLSSANSERVSSVSLRGLGPSSTLVLLNGKRRPGSINGSVFDVSAEPLSMIERIEVVTGGRSAIYGSDAVAGVVNIVTRTEYDGAQTQIYYGAADRGGERLNISQTLGLSFDRGSFVLGYDYRKDLPFDAADTGLEVEGATTTAIPGLFDLRPFSDQHTGLLSGKIDAGGGVEFYGDAHFSFKNTVADGAFNFAGLYDIGGRRVVNSTQYSLSGGVRIDLGADWQLDASGRYGVADDRLAFSSVFADSGTLTSLEPLTGEFEKISKLSGASVVVDGPLFDIGARKISVAIGAELRGESWKRERYSLPSRTLVPSNSQDRSRDIISLFGEMYIPLLERGDHSLDLSIAGRYDDYSDFGGTFNPQFGLEWSPVNALTIRGSYSSAFRVPTLFDLVFGNQLFIDNVVDPTTGGTIAQFTRLGGNSELDPEKADTWTAGVDWRPFSQTSISLSYFNIQYSGRIDEPLIADRTTVLAVEGDFADLILRSPTAPDFAAALNLPLEDISNQTGIAFDPLTEDPQAVFPGAIIFDNRRNNIGLEKVSGIDFQASAEFPTNFGDLRFGLNGTYFIDLNRNVTRTSPTISRLNKPGELVDFRVRANAEWANGPWRLNAYINYVDSYSDTLATSPTKIDSWTTVDLTLRFDASKITENRYLDGFIATLAVDNVFSADPPFFGNGRFGLGYDPVNADPFGRFVSIRLSKDW